jgi:hypothetical protein
LHAGTAPTTKTDYLNRLAACIAQTPGTEILKALSFYEEMIDDRIEDGISEAEAVAGLESPEAAAQTILNELPPVPRTVVKTRRRSEPLFWTLLILGSPIWLSLGIAFAAVAFSGYVVIWALGVFKRMHGEQASGPISSAYPVPGQDARGNDQHGGEQSTIAAHHATESNIRTWRIIHIVAACAIAFGVVLSVTAGVLGGWDPNLLMLMP